MKSTVITFALFALFVTPNHFPHRDVSCMVLGSCATIMPIQRPVECVMIYVTNPPTLECH